MHIQAQDCALGLDHKAQILLHDVPFISYTIRYDTIEECNVDIICWNLPIIFCEIQKVDWFSA